MSCYIIIIIIQSGLKYGLHLNPQTIAHHKARTLVTLCTSYTNNKQINDYYPELNFEFVFNY